MIHPWKDLQVGARFLHSRLLNDRREPLVCRVTTRRQGVIYFRPIDGGHPGYFPATQVDKWVKEILPKNSEIASGPAGGTSEEGAMKNTKNKVVALPFKLSWMTEADGGGIEFWHRDFATEAELRTFAKEVSERAGFKGIRMVEGPVKDTAEAREVKMFGCTVADLRAAVADLKERNMFPRNAQELAVSILSDSQELLDMGRAEQARQHINRAKWFLTEGAK